MKELSVHASFFVLLACLSSVMSEEGCLALCVRFRVSLVALSGTLKLVDVHTSVMKKNEKGGWRARGVPAVIWTCVVRKNLVWHLQAVFVVPLVAIIIC